MQSTQKAARLIRVVDLPGVMKSRWNAQIEDNLSAKEIRGLYMQTDWADMRDEDGINMMINNTSLCFAVRDQSKLVGFARILTDYTYRAFIEDVIVDKEYRGQGVGSSLMQSILSKLSNVQELCLGCAMNNVSYYERFGFSKVTNACMQYKPNK